MNVTPDDTRPQFVCAGCESNSLTLSSPSTRILASFSPKRESSLDIHRPMPSCAA